MTITSSDGEVYQTIEEWSAAMSERWDAEPWWKKAHVYAIRYRRQFDHLRRQPRYMWQRARRGYSEQDTWGFHPYLASVIVGGLTRLRDRSLGYPSELGSGEEWDAILTEIIDGFALIEKIESSLDVFTPEEQEKFDRAVALLGKWFQNLWD